jgi:hypothetical protein
LRRVKGNTTGASEPGRVPLRQYGGAGWLGEKAPRQDGEK